MNGKYAVAIDGNVVIWENGEYKAENKELLEAIEDAEEESREKQLFRIGLDGSLLYSGEWIRPSERWATSFGFLQDLTGGDLEFIAGDRPTWEKLGFKEKKNAVY